jgi:putative hydrolase of the HAD superfamily
VIAHFDYRIAAERLGRPIGLSGEALMKIALERDFHPLLMELESGRIHELVFFEELKKRLSLPQSIEQIAADWADIFTANQPVHNLAHQLKDEGYQLVLGSNTNAVHARQFRSQFDELLSRFDALITSHEVGEMKPHSLFYQRCCEAVDARPEECVFIDDIQENVLGAQDAGLYGVHYTTIDRLKSSLRSLGVSL